MFCLAIRPFGAADAGRFQSLPLQFIRQRRVRQLAAGVSLVGALMDRYGLAVTEVSDAGLREGALLLGARFGADWLANLHVPGTTAHIGAARNLPDGA